MSIFTDLSGLIKSAVGNNHENDEDDVTAVKTELSNRGYYSRPVENGILDSYTDKAIRSFQKDNGLKVDGYMLAGGPTVSMMQAQNAKDGYKYLPSVKDEDVKKYIRKFEGELPFFYKDSRDKVTLGVGRQIKDQNEAIKAPLYFFEGGNPVREATNQEKIDAFNGVQKLSKKVASEYDPLLNNLRNIKLKREGVEKIFDEDLQNQSTQLKNYIEKSQKKNFIKDPPPVQLFQMDMQYNLDNKYSREHWKNLFTAYDKKDWKGMASESHRTGVQETRNQAAYDLLSGNKTIQQILNQK